MALDYDEKEQNRLVEAIYLGFVSLYFLPKKLYQQTAKELNRAVKEGYGTSLGVQFGEPDKALLAEFRENIYMFSAAKTATQVNDIKSLMYDGDRIRPMNEFKTLALEKFKTYNVSHLESEYITAHTAGSSAKNFRRALRDKDLFPTLTAIVIMDEMTAPECARMSNVTAPVDHPIWNHNIAPRHFRCRCHEVLNDKYDKVKPSKGLNEIIEANDKDMQPMFKMNPVYDKVIFSKKHPYFDIGRRYKSLARKNWNLPIPK